MLVDEELTLEQQIVRLDEENFETSGIAGELSSNKQKVSRQKVQAMIKATKDQERELDRLDQAVDQVREFVRRSLGRAGRAELVVFFGGDSPPSSSG